MCGFVTTPNWRARGSGKTSLPGPAHLAGMALLNRLVGRSGRGEVDHVNCNGPRAHLSRISESLRPILHGVRNASRAWNKGKCRRSLARYSSDPVSFVQRAILGELHPPYSRIEVFGTHSPVLPGWKRLQGGTCTHWEKAAAFSRRTHIPDITACVLAGPWPVRRQAIAEGKTGNGPDSLARSSKRPTGGGNGLRPRSRSGSLLRTDVTRNSPTQIKASFANFDGSAIRLAGIVGCKGRP